MPGNRQVRHNNTKVMCASLQDAKTAEKAAKKAKAAAKEAERKAQKEIGPSDKKKKAKDEANAKKVRL